MPQEILISAEKFLQPKFQPSVVTWNRLEGRPRRKNFDRSLRAEVRDALWMLCRQWQFGEFKGEDGGSAVLAQVQVDGTRLNRYAVRENGALGYDDSVPLEVRVEAEKIPFDLKTRIQMGRHWLKLLKSSGDLINNHTDYLSEYGFSLPNNTILRAHLESDVRAKQLFRAVQGRLVDGRRLLSDIRGGGHDDFVDTKIPASKRSAAKAAAAEFQAWFERVYFEPKGADDSGWASDYLEYQFACSAPAHETEEEQIVLTAEQYHGGELEWYSFDRDVREGAVLASDAENGFPPSRRRAEDPLAFIPSPVEFSGMPNTRWWEFEDGRTDFGNLQASTTDLVTLVFAEFGLIYSNDWSVLPYDLEVGSLSKVRGVIITDVFGVKTFIRPAPSISGTDTQNWSMFNLEPQNHKQDGHSRIFLAPTLAKLQEGKPIERVLLARDEMANMVWGVEDIIPGALGTGLRGYQAANDLSRYFGIDQPPTKDNLEENDAGIRYKLGTTVPENWMPFIAVREPASNREIRLRRAAMPRFGDQQEPVRVEPRGLIFRDGIEIGDELKPYFVHEEEVPRAGVIVTRSFQRARWWNGKIFTWLGRRKRVGRGEASSGLAFDQIVPIKKRTDNS